MKTPLFNPGGDCTLPRCISAKIVDLKEWLKKQED